MIKSLQRLLCFSFILLGATGLFAQEIELQGKTKITQMDTLLDIPANVIQQADGTLALRQYKVGDAAHGGLIFYVDESGEHGLVADTIDVSTLFRWMPVVTGVNTFARGDGMYAGKMNTLIIIAKHSTITTSVENYAARACANTENNGFGDWYLPSLDELNLMYTELHLAGLGNFNNSQHWCSKETNDISAVSLNFSSGVTNTFTNKLVSYWVRRVRSF